MVRFALVAMIAAVALAGLAHADGSQVSHKRYLPVVASTLRENHAKLDGSLILDVRDAGPCRAIIQTERGFTTVKWTDLANNAPYTKGKMDHQRTLKPIWFALGDDEPLAYFAGVWTPHACVRKIKTGWEEIDAFAFLTTESAPPVAAIIARLCP